MYLSDITLEEILIGGIIIVLVLMLIFVLSALSKSRMRMDACNKSIDKLGEKVNSIGTILDDRLDKLEKQEVIIQQIPVPMPAAEPAKAPAEDIPVESILTEEELAYARATGQLPPMSVQPDDDIEFGQDEISFDDMDVFGEYTQEDAAAAAYLDAYDDDVDIKDFSDLMDIDDGGVEELFLETVTEDEPAPQPAQPVNRQNARRDTAELYAPPQVQPVQQPQPAPQPVRQPQPVQQPQAQPSAPIQPALQPQPLQQQMQQPEAIPAFAEIPPAPVSDNVPAFAEMPPESARKPRLRKVPANKHLRKAGKPQAEATQPQPVYEQPQSVYEQPQAAYEAPQQLYVQQPQAQPVQQVQPAPQPVQPQPAYEQPIYEEPSYESMFKKHQGYDIGRSGKRYTVTELETLIRE